ncbi:MAG: hypothetical protein JW891_15765, partial [Candidatus Lokiarchaeota archaeon]|nr:hypothetical protein [Candidatus Lokiarchaeota archaeon]
QVKMPKNSYTRIIIRQLAHHDPNKNDFNNHVVYIFNRAICLGCLAFYSGIVIALILCNIFYYFIKYFLNFEIIFFIFILFWSPSIFQYLLQAWRKKALFSRKIKFLTRFLYPVGSIVLIFKWLIVGFIVSIPAGLLILFIRKLFYKKLKSNY